MANLEQPVLAEHGLELPPEFAHRGDAGVGAGERPPAGKSEEDVGVGMVGKRKGGEIRKIKLKTPTGRTKTMLVAAPGPLFFYKMHGRAQLVCLVIWARR